MSKLNPKCACCFFASMCGCEGSCDFYYPVTERAEDRYLLKLQVEEKEDFYKAWLAYISDWKDG